jgi:predicted Zn-dependent peptidase
LIQSTELDSGARIILETVDNTDVASIGLWQLNGSRDEDDSEVGYTHFLEHMLFKGTARRSAYQIAQAVERVGGYLNAFTEKEVTCFYCTLPGEAIELAIDVLTDIYFAARLDEQELRKEKTVIANEIKTIEDNPEEKGQQIYLENLWNGHSLSRKITGEVHQVEEISNFPADGVLGRRRAGSREEPQHPISPCSLGGSSGQVRAGSPVHRNQLRFLHQHQGVLSGSGIQYPFW